MISISGFILACILLKKGYRDTAGTVVILYLHSMNLVGGLRQGLPFPALLACFSYVNYCYFMTKSTTLVIVNNLINVVEFFLYIRKILDIFQITLTDDQYVQVMSAMVALVFVFGIMATLNYFQKNIECNLWRLLNENFKKSENLTKEVVQAMNAKDSFVSSLSHEVRNVLNSLNGSVDYLLMVLKDSPHLQALKNARMSGEILFNLVSNALDAAKIRADKLELCYSEANIEDIVKRAFVINSENLKCKNIFAKAFIDSRIPKNLWVDSGRMLQILMNLMSNACKFTPRGGQIRVDVLWCKQNQPSQDLLNPLEEDGIRETQIPQTTASAHSIEDLDESVMEFSIDEEQSFRQNLTMLHDFPLFEPRKSRKSPAILYSSEHCQISTVNLDNPQSSPQRNQPDPDIESGFLKIQVSDTGCGIAKDNLPKLFEMYIQADHTISSNYGGTGLGLWICKQLCHKMQGDVAVSSQAGIGTKFVFYIPVDNVRKSSEGVVIPDKISVLVVDDSDFNRDLHKLLLEREGVQVTLAKNGFEAVEKYKEKGEDYFDFIFMDISMPIMDGFAATKEIRRWEAENNRKKIIIYFVSGEYFNDNEVIETLKTTGGLKDITDIKFLRKPIEVEMVAKIVGDHKRKNRTPPISPHHY